MKNVVYEYIILVYLYIERALKILEYYLAIDIGASSGRHILAWLEDGKLKLKEIYRFDNDLKREGNSLIWDMEKIVVEVKRGIKECKNHGAVPKSIAIDTWGVDYVLLDADKKPILPAYSYRDMRTEYAVGEVESIIPPSELYAKTGIQKQNFNTVYQLYCDKKSGRLNNAEYFLMMPEYLSYRLTGVMKNEYTIASTSGLLNAAEKDWDEDIIDSLGFPKKLFRKLYLPGESVGSFSDEMREEAGFDSNVVLCPSHDTACAVLACPIEDGGLFISSGTWSLIGVELDCPITSEEARLANFTNEGNIDYRFRFLKNYMGMWLLQNIRKNLGKRLSYDEMMNLAEKCGKITYIDVNSPELTAPENMIEAVKKVAGKPDMELCDVINCVYHSLARSYADAIGEIERLTNRKINGVNIVGGGSSDDYLNRLTSRYSGRKVSAGPREATAAGNIISQIIRDNDNFDIQTARECIKRSFDICDICENN